MIKRDNNLTFWTIKTLVVPNEIDPVTCQPKKMEIAENKYIASIEIYEEFHYPDKTIQFPTWFRFKGRLGVPKVFPDNSFPYRQSFKGEFRSAGTIMLGRVQLQPQHGEVYRTSRIFGDWVAGYFYFEGLKGDS